MDDVDDHAVRAGAQAQRTHADEQRGQVQQVRQVVGHVQPVVEGQHQQVARQDGDLGPVHVVLEPGGRRGTRLHHHLRTHERGGTRTIYSTAPQTRYGHFTTQTEEGL